VIIPVCLAMILVFKKINSCKTILTSRAHLVE
jgi:hypothetical protein